MIQRPVSYVALEEHTSPLFCAAFAKGCGGGDICDDKTLRGGSVAMFGSARLWHILMIAREQGRTWYYGDHGYFQKGVYYRVTRNALQHDGTGRAGPSRFEKFGIPIKPWRKDGDHVLVCPPGCKFASLNNTDDEVWLRYVCAKIRAVSHRPIVIRKKDRRANIDRPLALDMANAWCVVGYTTNVLVHAALAGVPIFATAPCAAASVGSMDLDMIESPSYPDGREQFAYNLAANQWTLSEIESGECWRAIA